MMSTPDGRDGVCKILDVCGYFEPIAEGVQDPVSLARAVGKRDMATALLAELEKNCPSEVGQMFAQRYAEKYAIKVERDQQERGDEE
jgi:hypothetical protein